MQGQEGFPTRLLLADRNWRRSVNSESLQGMPTLCQTNPHPGPGAPDNPHHLAFRRMGSGLLGPFKKAPGGLTHLLVIVDKFTK
jgi:hypothetical protein